MPENTHVRMTAEQYDRYSLRDGNPWDQLLIDRLLEESEHLPREGRLLDIGAATAVLLVKLAAVERFANAELIGSDYFEDMVVEARLRVERAAVSHRIRIDREDVHALSYPDGYARWIISRSTIHHWSRPVTAFQEIHRVLAPGGIAIIHDIRRDAAPDAIARFNAWRAAAGVGRSVLEEKYTAGEVRSMCRDAGIEHSAVVVAPETGPGAMGFELRITKAMAPS